MVGRRTLRKLKLPEALRTSKSLAEAKVKAGYSPKSNKIYSKGIKRYIASIMGEGKLKAEDIENLHLKLVDLSLSKDDLTNASRNVEGLGRIKAVYTDKQQIKTEGTMEISQKSHIINRIRQLDQNINIPKTEEKHE